MGILAGDTSGWIYGKLTWRVGENVRLGCIAWKAYFMCEASCAILHQVSAGHAVFCNRINCMTAVQTRNALGDICTFLASSTACLTLTQWIDKMQGGIAGVTHEAVRGASWAVGNCAIAPAAVEVSLVVVEWCIAWVTACAIGSNDITDRTGVTAWHAQFVSRVEEEARCALSALWAVYALGAFVKSAGEACFVGCGEFKRIPGMAFSAFGASSTSLTVGNWGAGDTWLAV